MALATASTVPWPQNGSTTRRVAVFVDQKAARELTRAHAHRPTPGHLSRVREYVGAGPLGRNVTWPREAQKVRITGATMGDGARRFTAHDLVPKQRNRFLFRGAKNQIALVDPNTAATNVALKEDGRAFSRQPSQHAASAVHEPRAPAVEPALRNFGHVGQGRHDAALWAGGIFREPSQRFAVNHLPLGRTLGHHCASAT